MKNFKYLKMILTLLLFNLSGTFYAQWPTLSTPNVQVTSSASTGGDLKDYWACSDGVGGSFSIFNDDRLNPGNANSIYCQRIDRVGNVKFAANGVIISAIAAANQDRPKVTSDGSNNAIACWQDDRSSIGLADDIYTQKIDSFGVVQWTSNGVLICNAVGKQDKTWIVSDGSGGAIIAWEDARNNVVTGDEDIYVQRINSAGVVQWTANGVVVCNAVGRQKEIHMISDGVGGATLVWRDVRSGGNDIYAQKINSAGVSQWTVNGVIVCSAVDGQKKPKLTTDGGTGVIITWYDKRTGGVEDIYAQRLNSLGVAQWTADGIVICNATNIQKNPVIASDTYGGAVIAWEDKRTGTEDIYAQRVDSNGTIHWSANGNVVSNAVDVQKKVDISEANYGKVLLVWEDARTGGVEDIYLQVIDTTGTMLGAVNGIAVSTATDVQKKPFVFKSGVTDWITIWQDDRNKTVTGNTDLYAQGLNPTIVPVLPIELISFEANINEYHVDIKWITSSEINNDYFTIEKSKDFSKWEIVSRIKANGNSSNIVEYFDIDYKPYKGTSYYRLKQTDFDGVFKYFNIVPVKFEKNKMRLFPNPVKRGENLNLEISDFDNVLIVIRDMKGNEFYSKVELNIVENQIIIIPIDKEIPTGIYLVTSSSKDVLCVKKVVIN